MPNPDVISKGKFDARQDGNAVPADSYIFIRENNKKYLLLKFENPRKSTLTAISLKITLLNSRRREVFAKVSTFACNGKPNKSFVLNDKIEVPEECVSCKVDVISARYGSYVYTGSGDNERVDYSSPANEKFDIGTALDGMAWKSRKTSERTVKNRVLISAVSLILLAAVLLFTILQLVSFKSDRENLLYSGVEYTFADDSATSDVYVTGFNGTRSNLVIPASLDGHKVTKIVEGAFEGNTRIRSLTVEGDLVIEKSAFENCERLETISINNVSTIKDSAFSGCKSLTSVSADNLTVIGNMAFYNCTSLTSVSINNDKKTLKMGASAFAGCKSLKEAKFNQTISYPEDYSILRGCTALETLYIKNFNPVGGNVPLVTLFGVIGSSGTSLSLKEVTVEYLDEISDGFLAYTSVNKVKISSLSGDSIGENAFYECKNLTELNLPVSPKTVGDYAFYSTKLASFDFERVEHIGEGAFYGTSLQNFSLPKLTYLGKQAFAYCTMSHVVISKVLQEIGVGAFEGCASMTSLDIPDNITRIGLGALSSCSSLEYLSVPFIGGTSYDNTYLGYIFGEESEGMARSLIPKSLKTVTVTGISSIPRYAFYNAPGLQRVNLPERVSAIWEYAFANCLCLEAVNLSEDLILIGDYAFKDCFALKSVVIPDFVSSIGQNAFSGCRTLSEYTAPFVGGGSSANTALQYIFGDVPESLTTVTITKAASIDVRAFYDCSNITQINLPANLKEIKEYAFYKCGFTGIDIPETVELIGDFAFQSCVALESIIIPASVKYIGRETTFADCYRLWEIWNYSGLDIVARNAHIYTGSDVGMDRFEIEGFTFGYSLQEDKFYLLSWQKNSTELVLPTAFQYHGKQVEEYEIPAYLFSGTNIVSIVVPKEVAVLGERAFEKCDKLVSVNLSNSSLTAVDNSAFINCTSLKSVTLPETIVKIDERAFQGCSSLSEINFPVSLEKIGARAFAGCTSLTVIVFGGVTEISDSAFESCTDLRSITLPKTLKSIGPYAFYGCINLAVIYNLSSLTLTPRSTTHGYVAYYADKIYTDIN